MNNTEELLKAANAEIASLRSMLEVLMEGQVNQRDFLVSEITAHLKELSSPIATEEELVELYPKETGGPYNYECNSCGFVGFRHHIDTCPYGSCLGMMHPKKHESCSGVHKCDKCGLRDHRSIPQLCPQSNCNGTMHPDK